MAARTLRGPIFAVPPDPDPDREPLRVGKSRTPGQVEADRYHVAIWYAKGVAIGEMSQRLKMHPATIRADIKAVIRQWREATFANIDEKRAEQLAKIDTVELTYWEEWERSREPRKSKTTNRGTRAAAMRKVVSSSSERTETQLGNPAYLAGVMTCIERRCKLLGLDAPQRTVGETFVYEYSNIDPNAL